MFRPRTLVALVSLALGAVHCSHAWDDYDPRLEATGGAGASTSVSSSSGATGGGDGGATTTSSASSSSSSSSSSSVSSANGGAGGQGGTGGVGGGEGGAAPGCGPSGISTLVDDFNDGVIGPQWDYFSNSNSSIAEENGELRITLGAEVSGSFAGMTSVSSFVLTDCQVFVKVTSDLDPMTNGYAALAATAGDSYAEIILAHGFLGYKTWIGPVQNYYGDVPYDPEAHRWWRLRETAGTLHYEASPDAVSWTTLYSVATPFSVADVKVMLDGGTYQAEPIAPGEARFDSLNIPP
jgi:hypothetical protein